MSSAASWLGGSICGTAFLIKTIRHSPREIFTYRWACRHGFKKPHRFKLCDRRLQSAFQLPRIVVSADADMLAGKFREIKFPARFVVEPLVQKPVHAFGRGILKLPKDAKSIDLGSLT